MLVTAAFAMQFVARAKNPAVVLTMVAISAVGLGSYLGIRAEITPDTPRAQQGQLQGTLSAVVTGASIIALYGYLEVRELAMNKMLII